ncbi:dynactin subunit 1 [Acrasis kona]|uniref:Dynactin subunit 1 n=1 Tax=Acrasis kona TaxID=1008807 RepID=A0AAW2YXW5_9EUKA
MLVRFLLLCAIVVSVLTQVPFDRIKPRRNLCRTQTEDFKSWRSFSYITPPAPAYDDGSIKHTLRTISDSTPVYQAQIYQASTKDHFAWPLLDFSQTAVGKFQTPVYIDFYFLTQGFNVPSNGYASIATFSPDGDTPNRYISLDMNSQGMLYLNRVPAQNSPVGNWIFQKTNNLINDNTWMNITVYLDFNPAGGIAAVWQDGVLQSVANVTGSSSATLGQLHLGIAASGSISSGSIYNYGLNVMQVCEPTNTDVTTAPSAPTQRPTTTQPPSGTTTTSASTTTTSATTTTLAPTTSGPTTTQAPANIPIPQETTTDSPVRSSSTKQTVSYWLFALVVLNVIIQGL